MRPIGKALAPLGSDAEFGEVAIAEDGWSIEWPSGVDFAATQLRGWAVEWGALRLPESLAGHG